MQQLLITLTVVGACIASIFANQERLLQSFNYQSSHLDWCEENYQYSPYIVEFWNTISSFAMCIIGILGYTYYRMDEKTLEFEPGINTLWGLMFIVGIGSVYFHGTLSVVGQICDEVPIVILAAVAIMMSRPRLYWNGTSRDFALNEHTVIRFSSILLVICIFYPFASHIFTVLVFPIGGYFFFGGYAKSKNPKIRGIFWTATTTFFISFGSWLFDRLACDSITKLGYQYIGAYPQLHAIWHIFIAITFWFLVVMGIMMRAEIDGVKMEARYDSSFLPIATVV